MKLLHLLVNCNILVIASPVTGLGGGAEVVMAALEGEIHSAQNAINRGAEDLHNLAGSIEHDIQETALVSKKKAIHGHYVVVDGDYDDPLNQQNSHIEGDDLLDPNIYLEKTINQVKVDAAKERQPFVARLNEEGLDNDIDAELYTFRGGLKVLAAKNSQTLKDLKETEELKNSVLKFVNKQDFLGFHQNFFSQLNIIEVLDAVRKAQSRLGSGLIENSENPWSLKKAKDIFKVEKYLRQLFGEATGKLPKPSIEELRRRLPYEAQQFVNAQQHGPINKIPTINTLEEYLEHVKIQYEMMFHYRVPPNDFIKGRYLSDISSAYLKITKDILRPIAMGVTAIGSMAAFELFNESERDREQKKRHSAEILAHPPTEE